jgi:hypothetical protein
MHLQYGHSVFERTYRIGADGKAHLAGWRRGRRAPSRSGMSASTVK